MKKPCSLGCILSIFLFLLISGCSKPILKIPQNLPPVVREYKNVAFHVDAKRMQKTGIYLTKGELFSIITRDILLRSSLIGMIGKDDFGFYVSDINDAYKPGDLYLGFMDQKVRPSAVDIIVWKEEDYVQVADFLNRVKADNPDNSAITGLLLEINRRKDIFLAELKASREIEDTKKKIKNLKKSNESSKEEPEKVITKKQSTTSIKSTSDELSKDEKIKQLETKLSKLTETLKEMAITAKEREQTVLKKNLLSEDSKKTKTLPYQDIDFGRYYALVVGNNSYQSLPKLVTAKNDAQEVAETLKNRYGFNVELLLDADRSDILMALSRYRWNLTNRDNLLIYYAGHGWLDKEADEGYWLPTNAEKGNMINWISNFSISATLRAIKAKHVLIVADSCYSGKLARGIHTVDRTAGYLSRLSQKRARSVISSGGLEPVTDSGGKRGHSVFASAFLDALRKNNTIMDGAQLFNTLRRPVMLNSDQTPEYSDIQRAGHEGGEFIFIPKNLKN
jgi:hypothetical protein